MAGRGWLERPRLLAPWRPLSPLQTAPGHEHLTRRSTCGGPRPLLSLALLLLPPLVLPASDGHGCGCPCHPGGGAGSGHAQAAPGRGARGFRRGPRPACEGPDGGHQAQVRASAPAPAPAALLAGVTWAPTSSRLRPLLGCSPVEPGPPLCPNLPREQAHAEVRGARVVRQKAGARPARRPCRAALVLLLLRLQLACPARRMPHQSCSIPCLLAAVLACAGRLSVWEQLGSAGSGQCCLHWPGAAMPLWAAAGSDMTANAWPPAEVVCLCRLGCHEVNK